MTTLAAPQPFSLRPSALLKRAIRLTALGPTGIHMTRYRMYHDIAKTMQPYAQRPQSSPVVLGIGRSLPLATLLGIPHAQIIDGDMPAYNLLDLSNVPDESVDYIASDQVLEHVKGNPQRAADESYRVLKPGGVAIHTTCLLEELHGGIEPNGHLRDYWRFTPNGLAMLFKAFSQVQTGCWGNKVAFWGFRYMPVPHASWHPLHKIAMWNQHGFPLVTWVVAQK